MSERVLIHTTAEFDEAVAAGISFVGASFFNADLDGITILGDVDLTGAVFNEATIENADLTAANLDGVNFSGVIYDTETVQFPEGFNPEAAGMRGRNFYVVRAGARADRVRRMSH